ncbi:MAG: hypothetical protein QM731_02095 [Chitinophagaceae bacterium]
MKLHLLILLFCIGEVGCLAQLPSSKTNTTLKFLHKTQLDTSHENKGQHIEIKQRLPKTDKLIPLSIDDRDIVSRSGYSRKDEIKILGEYLTFRGDTSRSNKKYHFKPANHMVRPEGISGFTVQIEALYSFTRMLMEGYPPIKPALIDCTTGEEVNSNPGKIKEIYEIYCRWYTENIKSDFKNISLPLDGSRYCWIGQNKDLKPFLKKDL